MIPVPIAVFVSGGGTNLQALLDAERAGALRSGRIALAVSSSPAAFALERAQARGVPASVIARKSYASAADYDAAFLRLLGEYGIRLIALAGFFAVLGATVLEAYKGRIINVHPSLLPAFGGRGFYGLKVHEAALARGVKVTGATVHFVNGVIDGGEIIAQKAVSVHDGDTPETLQQRVMREAEWVLYPAATEAVCAALLRQDA